MLIIVDNVNVQVWSFVYLLPHMFKELKLYMTCVRESSGTQFCPTNMNFLPDFSSIIVTTAHRAFTLLLWHFLQIGICPNFSQKYSFLIRNLQKMFWVHWSVCPSFARLTHHMNTGSILLWSFPWKEVRQSVASIVLVLIRHSYPCLPNEFANYFLYSDYSMFSY